MDFSNLSPAERYVALGQAIQAENAIAAYQVRESIPSTIDTPPWMRPPGPNAPAFTAQPAPPPPRNPDASPPSPELQSSERSRAFQKIIQDTERRNFETRLANQRQNQIQSLDRYFEDVQRPGYYANRAYEELNRQRQNTLDAIRQQNARRNPTPPDRPPSSTAARPTPTSLDNAPALRTHATSGARAPITATAPPRPALPSHWNLFQPPGSPPPPPAVRNIPTPPDSPPPSLPQSAARGRLAYGVAGSAADFGLRLAAGQDLGQAAYGAAGGFAGGLVGQGLGQAIGTGLGFAFGGPPGAAVGGTLGGLVGGLAGGYVGGGLADRYYPGNNAPLPGAPLPGQRESVPIPRPLSTPVYIPGPAIPFSPTPIGENRPRLGDLPNPSNPVSGLGPFDLSYEVLGGGPGQRANPLVFPVSSQIHGPVGISLNFERLTGNPDWEGEWVLSITHFSSADRARRDTPLTSTTRGVGWPEHPPRNFAARPLSLPNAPPTPFNPLSPNPWPPTPQAAPNPNPNNSPNEQYHPNPLPQPSATGEPTGEPLPGNLGGNEPELQPQRSPDRAAQPAAGDRAYPPGNATPSGVGPGRSNFPTVPFLPVAAPGTLPRQQRARVTTSAQRPTQATQPRGSGPPNPPPPPTTPQEPCRGNRCAQRQLEGIDNANNRLANLERVLLGGGEAGSTAAILRKLEEINQKLGPQIPNGGIGNFLKRLWDNLGIGKILNVLTFLTTLHNARMLSVDIIETLFVGFDQIFALTRFDDFLKNSEGEKISTSEWVGNAIEDFFKSVLGDETVEEIKVKYQKFNRIYQATANLLNAFQSIAWSILEALEVLGQWIAKIGNALKKYGVVFERAYAWMNPTPDFHNKLFTKLERAETLVNNLVQVTSSIQEVNESVEYFNQARTELRNQLELSAPAEERNLPDSGAILGFENLSAAQSASPPIEETDLARPEEDNDPT